MGTWYQRFDRFAALLDGKPSKAEILLAVDTLLDEALLYRSLTIAQHARQMVRRIIAARGWNRAQRYAEDTPRP